MIRVLDARERAEFQRDEVRFHWNAKSGKWKCVCARPQVLFVLYGLVFVVVCTGSEREKLEQSKCISLHLIH